MPSLISNDEITSYTGDLYNHFLTFRRPILIYKQEEQSFVNVNNNVFPGYNNINLSENIAYTTVTGLYSGLKYGPERQFGKYAPITHSNLPENNTYIKVERDCMEFIERGKTEKIVVDGLSYNVLNEVRPRNFLGLMFYEYQINKIN